MAKVQINSQGKVYVSPNGVLLANDSGGGGSTKFGLSIDNCIGNVDSNGVLHTPSVETNIVFSGVQDIDTAVLSNKFNSYEHIQTVSFPDLTTITGTSACEKAFTNCSALTSISFPNLTTITGNQACYGIYESCMSLTTVSFPELITVYNHNSSSDNGYKSLYEAFKDCQNLTTISFPKLTTLTGSYCCGYLCSHCSALTTVSFPELSSITGVQACQSMFEYCSVLTTVSFPKLSILTGPSACASMFNHCASIEDIYFPALTTSSFGASTNQFHNLMQNTATSKVHRIHFPLNLENTISALNEYPLFGGTSGYVTLVFDQPATS